jgi:predicted transcriptional regulator
MDSKVRRGIVRQASGQERRKIAAYLQPETGARLDMLCAKRRITLSQAVENALETWLDREESL